MKITSLLKILISDRKLKYVVSSRRRFSYDCIRWGISWNIRVLKSYDKMRDDHDEDDHDEDKQLKNNSN